MASEVRRIVTGHDANGRARVEIDQAMTLEPGPPGGRRVLWTTEGFPVDNDRSDDTSDRETGLTLPNGTVFRIVQFDPGNPPRRHRTSSVDYAVVMSGEIDMELDDEVVHLHAGDVLVQRGTVHNWMNRGAEPCRIAFVLIDAEPASVGGRVLHAEG
ncbi:MAG: cupin domain-containing protein [Candidatus Dormibacteraeota bacterium]|nr:cupin domain-containing protein [Candidatus Dormibacteraeota bacterium]